MANQIGDTKVIHFKNTDGSISKEIWVWDFYPDLGANWYYLKKAV